MKSIVVFFLSLLSLYASADSRNFVVHVSGTDIDNELVQAAISGMGPRVSNLDCDIEFRTQAAAVNYAMAFPLL